jgi:hypothetical protein
MIQKAMVVIRQRQLNQWVCLACVWVVAEEAAASAAVAHVNQIEKGTCYGFPFFMT